MPARGPQFEGGAASGGGEFGWAGGPGAPAGPSHGAPTHRPQPTHRRSGPRCRSCGPCARNQSSAAWEWMTGGGSSGGMRGGAVRAGGLCGEFTAAPRESSSPTPLAPPPPRSPVGQPLPLNVAVLVARPGLQEAAQRRGEHRGDLPRAAGGGGEEGAARAGRSAEQAVLCLAQKSMHATKQADRQWQAAQASRHASTPLPAACLLGVWREGLPRRDDAYDRRHREEVLGEEGRQAGHHAHGGGVQTQLLLRDSKSMDCFTTVARSSKGTEASGGTPRHRPGPPAGRCRCRRRLLGRACLLGSRPRLQAQQK